VLASPVPSKAESEANSTFASLLWAMSRPGLMHTLPAAGEVPMIRSLIDRECDVYSDNPALTHEIMLQGAQLSTAEKAEFLFLSNLQSQELLRNIRIGSDQYPEDGATLIISVQIGQGQKLRLSGPGVETTTMLQVAGLPSGFWQLRRELFRYPTGFDLFLHDGVNVVGIPRSTNIKEL